MESNKINESVELKEKYSEYPIFYEFKNGNIYDLMNQEVFTPYRSWKLFRTINEYFKTIYSALHTEAEVLILTKYDRNKLKYLNLPELNLPYPFNTVLYCVIPPQVNNINSTSIPKDWWNQHIKENNIISVIRILSHHVMPAGQHEKDSLSLNSNILEVSLGKIYDEIPQIEWWLDNDEYRKLTFHN